MDIKASKRKGVRETSRGIELKKAGGRKKLQKKRIDNIGLREEILMRCKQKI